MKNLVCCLLLSPLFAIAQDKGIKFEEGLSWKQIQEKAKKENKFIFVDCYASWCGPCKQMDENVYPLQNVGDYFNGKFVSIKLQMDRTNFDDSLTRSWYNDASNLQSFYSVTAFPTYLFFSADGKPLHKAVGRRNPEELISLARDAAILDRQYYSILKNFQPGKTDTSELKGVARSLAKIDKSLAAKMAADYLNRIPEKEWAYADNLGLMAKFQKEPEVLKVALKYINGLTKNELRNKYNIELIKKLINQSKVQDIIAGYLTRLKEEELGKAEHLDLMKSFKSNQQIHAIAVNYINNLSNQSIFTKAHISLIQAFTIKPENKYFNIFYKEGSRVDAVMQKGYAEAVVDGIVFGNDINPAVNLTKGERIPDFDSIHEKVRKKYGITYADRDVLAAKVIFYGFWSEKHNTWKEYLDYAIEKVEKYGPDNALGGPDVFINNLVWYGIFMHSTDTKQLATGLQWMEDLLKKSDFKDAGFIDTYANLLYKSGDYQKALEWETKAVTLSPKNKEFQQVLTKMQNGEKTWTEK